MLREEGGNQQQIYGQSRRTRHERHGEDGEDAVFAVLQGARGHDGGHTAPEPDDVRDERLAVQAHAVHQLVHDESGAGHVASVFQNGDEEEEDQDVRQERTDPSHPGDDAIDEQIFDDAVWQHAGDDIAQPAEETLQPCLRVRP